MVMGDDEQVYLEWAQGLGPENAWVIAAEEIAGMGSKKEQVEKAKEILSGDAELGGGFDAWLGGETVEVGEENEEQESEPRKKRGRRRDTRQAG